MRRYLNTLAANMIATIIVLDIHVEHECNFHISKGEIMNKGKLRLMRKYVKDKRKNREEISLQRENE